MLDRQTAMASETIAVLRGLDLLCGLPDASLGAIANRLRLRELARGEVLVTEGDEADARPVGA